MIRSRAITQSAKDEPCSICSSRGTTVFAHSNFSMHGKGRSIKAHDIFGAYLCHKCHTLYDSGVMPSEIFFRAMSKTQVRLVECGIMKIDGVEPENAQSKIVTHPMC